MTTMSPSPSLSSVPNARTRCIYTLRSRTRSTERETSPDTLTVLDILVAEEPDQEAFFVWG